MDGRAKTAGKKHYWWAEFSAYWLAQRRCKLIIALFFLVLCKVFVGVITVEPSLVWQQGYHLFLFLDFNVLPISFCNFLKEGAVPRCCRSYKAYETDSLCCVGKKTSWVVNKGQRSGVKVARFHRKRFGKALVEASELRAAAWQLSQGSWCTQRWIFGRRWKRRSNWCAKKYVKCYWFAKDF